MEEMVNQSLAFPSQRLENELLSSQWMHQADGNLKKQKDPT